MKEITPPKYLAPLIPVAPNEQIFRYAIWVDGSFEGGAAIYDGAVKCNMDGLPYQMHKAVYKAGSKTSIGFNVFKEGVDINYQPFWWAGGPPATGRLASDRQNWCFAGPVMVLNRDNLQEATAKVDPYPWLKCTVAPVQCAFQLEAMPATIERDPASLQVLIGKTTIFDNQTDEDTVYTPTIEATFNERALTSVTDTRSFEAGINLHVQQEVNWFAGKTTFGIDLHFAYGYTHQTTAISEATNAYTVSEKQEVNVRAHQTKYVSVIFRGDLNATARINVPIRLSGQMDGVQLDSTYLMNLARSMSPDTRFAQFSSDWVEYIVSGDVEAHVVQDSEIVQTDSLEELNQYCEEIAG